MEDITCNQRKRRMKTFAINFGNVKIPVRAISRGYPSFWTSDVEFYIMSAICVLNFIRTCDILPCRKRVPHRSTKIILDRILEKCYSTLKCIWVTIRRLFSRKSCSLLICVLFSLLQRLFNQLIKSYLRVAPNSWEGCHPSQLLPLYRVITETVRILTFHVNILFSNEAFVSTKAVLEYASGDIPRLSNWRRKNDRVGIANLWTQC